MGQRLNIEICYGESEDNVLANCYYHWDGFSASSAEHGESIVKKFKELGGVGKNDVGFAVDLICRNAEGFNPDERLRLERINYVNRYKKPILIRDSINRNEGLIAITPEGIEETRLYEEARLTVDILNQKIDFSKCMNVELVSQMDEIWFEERPPRFAKAICDPMEIPFRKFESFVNVIGRGYDGMTWKDEPEVVWFYIQ